MKSYLLDTNIIIDFLKGEHDAYTALQSIQNEKLSISVITIAEYQYGALRATNTKEILTQFDTLCKQAHISVIDIDKEVAETFARIQAHLGKKGLLRPAFDLLIASSCIVHNCTLVTKNLKDFRGIDGLKIFT